MSPSAFCACHHGKWLGVWDRLVAISGTDRSLNTRELSCAVNVKSDLNSGCNAVSTIHVLWGNDP